MTVVITKGKLFYKRWAGIAASFLQFYSLIALVSKTTTSRMSMCNVNSIRHLHEIIGHAYNAEYSWMGDNFSRSENIIEWKACALSKPIAH